MRRTVIGGAFGALATATVAASAAFACHPTSYLELSTSEGPPGTTMRIEGNGFDPGRDLEIRWSEDGTLGEVLTTTPVKDVDTVSGRAQAEAVVQIPRNAAVRAEPYTVVGIQTGANGTTLRAVKRFTVVAPAVSPVPQVPANPPAQVQPVTPVTPATPATAPADPVIQAAPAASAPARTATASPAPAAPVAAPERTSAPAAPVPSPATAPVVSPSAAATATAPAPSAASPAVQTAAPGPDDLWSAVGAERRPSLLDAPAAAGERGGAPIGAIVSGAGVLALAGVALMASRRRLALAHRRPGSR